MSMPRRAMRGGDAAVAEPVPVRVGVVALVRAQFGRSAASGSAGADGRQAGHHGLQGLAVVGVGRGHPDHQRDARGVGENLQLGAGFGAVDRVGAGQRSPLLARTLGASRIAEDQSISPCAPSRSRIARCSRAQRPPRSRR